MSEPQSKSQQNNIDAAENASNGSSDVGALLRASRLRIGEELRDVAEVLRIRYRYLEDIEAGRFSSLPGTTYAMGFIRTYADHLGLDGEEVVRRFKEEIAESKEEENLEFPAPIGEADIPAGAVIFVGLVIAVLAYGAWYINTTEKGFIAELISPLPDRLAKILPDDGKAPGEPPSTPAPSAPASDQSLESVVSGLTKTAPAVNEATQEKMDGQASVSESQDKPSKPMTSAASGDLASPDASSATTAEQPTEPAPSVQSTESENASMTSQQAAMTEPDTPKAPIKLPKTLPKKVMKKEIKKEVEQVKKIEPVKEIKQEPLPAPLKIEPKKKPVETVAPEASPESSPITAPQVASRNTPIAKPAATVPTPETSSSTSGSTSVGRVYGVENSNARIIVRAKKNSWIQVRDDVANKLLLTRLLRSGDSYRVPNRAGLKLLAGNAGALDILVDGKSVPSIGPQGAVRRSVALDAKRLLEGKAVIE